MDVANPVVLLLGKTGAGKSTLGNLLLSKPYDDGPFYASADMESVTKECSTTTMSINGKMYNLVDTPGIFDTQEDTGDVLKKIAKYVNGCAHGVKAILIVFEARRFTEEQKNALNGVRTFLGKDATNHIIIVFSHANIKQTSDKDEMQKTWNDPVKTFVQNIGNRWSVSPNPYHFSSDDSIHKARLREIEELISGMQGVYTTEQLEKNLKKQEEIRRQKLEEERRKKLEHEEKLKEIARREAEEANRRKVEQMKREEMARRQEEEERHRQMMERVRQEQKARQEREEQLMRRQQQEAEERYRQQREREECLRRRRLQEIEEQRRRQQRELDECLRQEIEEQRCRQQRELDECLRRRQEIEEQRRRQQRELDEYLRQEIEEQRYRQQKREECEAEERYRERFRGIGLFTGGWSSFFG